MEARKGDWKDHMKIRTRDCLAVPVLLCLACTSPALAGDEVPADEPAAFAGLVPVSTDNLEEQRGLAGLQVDRLQINDQDLTAVLTDNTATGNVTGGNLISDTAFGEAAGFITAIQNTGNNVVIQNATIINVSLEP